MPVKTFQELMSLKQAKQDIKKDEQDGWRLRKLDK